MPIPVQIVFHEINVSDALDSFIRQKTGRLESLFPNLMRCHITVEQPHRHQSKGRPFNVRIVLHVPGEELIVNHDQNPDPYAAVRDAFDAARRQLENHSGRLHTDMKPDERPEPPTN